MPIKPLPALLACFATVLIAACSQTNPTAPAANAAPEKPQPKIAWDWTGIVGTGQSLAVGDHGRQIASTTQPFHNMRLATGNLPWPIDPNNDTLKLQPLIEPVGRRSVGYPSAWPTNIAGETPHSAMANEMTTLVQAAFGRDFISVHSEVGENGQGIRFLKKNPVPQGVNGRAFEATLVETKAIARLAKAAGKTFGIGGIIITHGENDAGNLQYEEQLHQLWQDYNTDLPAITGQKEPILMIVSQQNSTNDRSASTLAQWKIGVEDPKNIVCSGPKYQYPSDDGTHLTTDGYRALGEKYAQVYFERVILGRDWQPLQPTTIQRDGPTMTVHFHVPVGPLAWETQFDAPHQGAAEWAAGKGFEVTAAGERRVAITSVALSGDAVVITCATDPGPNARVSYAMIADGRTRMAKPFAGTTRWGLLKDSDPFQGSVTGHAQPNYALAFEMIVP